MVRNLADRVLNEIDKKKNPCIVGLDPLLVDPKGKGNEIPRHIKERAQGSYGNTPKGAAEAIKIFNRDLIDEIRDVVALVKPQSAHYEKYGSYGIEAYKSTVDYAKNAGLIVIADVKRNDIGRTSRAYADAYLGEVDLFDGKKEKSFDVDIITTNCYLGSDGILPFTEVCKEYGKGIFIIDKTSNKSSGEFQDRVFENGKKLSEEVAVKIDEWGKEEGLIGERNYSSVGAVIGTTYPEEATKLRKIMPYALILGPGMITQGGTAKDSTAIFNKDGYGGLPSASSGIDYACNKEPYKNNFRPEEFAQASRQAAIDLRDDVLAALKEAGKLPDGW